MTENWQEQAAARFRKHADACHLCKARPLACLVGQALLGIASGMRPDPAPAGQLEMGTVLEAVGIVRAPERRSKAAESAEPKPHFVFARVGK